MTPKKRGTAVGAAAPHTQTENPRRNPEGVCVPEGPHAHSTTDSTTVDASAGSFRVLLGSRVVPGALFLSACSCFIASIVELPEHPLHATLWIVAGAFLWFTGEVTS